MKRIALAAAAIVLVPTLAHAQARTDLQVKTRAEVAAQAAARKHHRHPAATRAHIDTRTNADVRTDADARSHTDARANADVRLDADARAREEARERAERAEHAAAREPRELPPRVDAGAKTDVRAGATIGRGAAGVTTGVGAAVGGVLGRP